MPDDIRQSVYTLLEQLPKRKLDALKQLFWSELNYNRANEPLSTRDWPQSVTEYWSEPPTLFGTAGQDDGFHLIYTRLKDEQLLLSPQRPIISQLLNRHPYTLFIFSDKNQMNWHFVNVRYEKDNDARTRRVFRRITVGPFERLRTATERISLLDIATLSPDLFGLSPLVIQQRHDEAFNVEAVTREFFRTYRAIFEQTERGITAIKEAETRRLFTQRLFNRLLFIVFLERKGWLIFPEGDRQRHDFLQALWEAHRREKRAGERVNFYNDRLKLLFFAGLNTENEVNIVGANPDGFLQTRIGRVPYLNGGLFEEDDLDRNPKILVPDEALLLTLDELLYRYNFTVTESTPLDMEVAVDPEMLGKIFEELVTGRHESGSYYTPKPVVAFMGQEALKGYLETACPGETAAAIAAFVEQRDATGLRNPERVLEALKTVKICDPACGSGAYLLGMMHELLDLRGALFAARQLDPLTAYQRKLEIIQNNLYGVDLDPFAVNIARLRLWLSLIVEFEGDNPPPLPNLDFKIEAGDSLTAPDPSGGLQPDMFRQQQVGQYFRLKGEYLEAHGPEKLTLRQEIDKLRAEIAAWAHPKGGAEGFDWAVEFAEVFAGPQLAAATLTGAMAGIVNAVPGQMQLTVGGDKQSGFDIILANPPYVRQELIKDLKPTLGYQYGHVYDGRADLYVYFYARALELLRPNGMLVFISSNKWFRAKYGAKLRAFLANHTNVLSIIDFGELPVFEAATFPMIFIAQKGKGKAKSLFTPVQSLDPPYPNIRELVRQSGYELDSEAIKGENWLLANKSLVNILRKMEVSATPLGKYVNGDIFMGVKTGLSEAFQLNQKEYEAIVSDQPRCAEIIKPLLVGNDIRRWRIEGLSQWLIYTPPGIDMKPYKAILDHLKRWKPQLEARALGQKWYELQQAQFKYAQSFVNPKIVYPDIAKESRFALDTKGFYLNNTAYFLPIDDLYLLGVLNSVAIWNYAREKLSVLGDAGKGGRLRFFRQFVQALPIPQVPTTERAIIVSLVQKCLDARGQGPKIADWEAEINERVARLYGI